MTDTAVGGEDTFNDDTVTVADSSSQHVDVSHQMFVLQELTTLIQSWKSLEHTLVSIDMSYCTGGKVFNQVSGLLDALRDTLPFLTSLSTLNVSGNYFFNAAPHPLNDHVKDSLTTFDEILRRSTVKHLNLTDTKLIGKSSREMRGFISLCNGYLSKRAVSLFLKSNSLHSLSAGAVSGALHGNRTLLTLDLSDNAISRDNRGLYSASGVIDLCRALENNHTLRCLDLSYNLLPDQDVAMIFVSAAKMPQLESLLLANNLCGPIGLVALRNLLIDHSLLEDSHGLKYLDLASNPLEGALSSLDQGIRRSETLSHFDISGCGLTDDDMDSVEISLQQNHTLTSLIIDGNSLSHECYYRIESEIKANNLLQCLEVDPMCVDVSELSGQVRH
jgi:Ran GTPase-activating protein (RanGAP) involved in mRNA processing and transport